MPTIVSKDDNIHKDNIKINTEIKYLFVSTVSNLDPENSSLFTNIFKGFACDASSFIENLNSEIE